MSFNQNILEIDAKAEIDRIVQTLRDCVVKVMHKRGAVLGVSGGVDSSLTLALCVRAFSSEHVTALLLPDKDSNPASEVLARQVAKHLGIEPILENITPTLEGFGCYSRRDVAIRRVFPEYNAAAGYKAKIVLPANILNENTLNVFSLTIITPSGEEKTQRLAASDYLQIEAASNFKQRTRMSMIYYYAERQNYAVIGTANRDELEQGFFVKYGDGGVDIQPIAHLYKTQVYQLAKYLDILEEVLQRIPTTDTYSALQTQEEFFFRLPFATLDLLCYAKEHTIPLAEVSAVLGLTEEQIKRVYDDLDQKERTTQYLRMPPFKLAPPS
jgi:NAD+ synthase